MEESNVRDIVRAAIQEFTKSETARQEPAYKAELIDEMGETVCVRKKAPALYGQQRI